jgi:hypothetical protein
MTTAERQARFRQSLRERGLVELRGAFVPVELLNLIPADRSAFVADAIREKLEKNDD